MAEGSAGSRSGFSWSKVTKNASKYSKRMQQKVLEKMAKADRTTDEVYEEFVTNFKKQENGATRMKTELIKYLNNLKFLSQSTKSLMDTFNEVYEADWAGKKEYSTIAEQNVLLWENMVTNLSRQVNDSLDNYMPKFPDIQVKISKQARKLTDYDAARRKYEETKAQQGRDPRKVQQVEDMFMDAKQKYDDITDELYDELPTFYDSRIEYYASMFYNISSATAHFHEEAAKLDARWVTVMEKLQDEAKSNVHTTKRERPPDSSSSYTLRSRPANENHEDLVESGSELTAPEVTVTKPTIDDASNKVSEDASPEEQDDSVAAVADSAVPPSDTKESPSSAHQPVLSDDQPVSQEPTDGKTEDSDETPAQLPTAQESKTEEPPDDKTAAENPPSTEEQQPSAKETVTEEEGSKLDEKSKVPPPKPPPLEQTNHESPDLLFKVRATHKYEGQDDDELSFEKGQIIHVVPFEDPEDQDEGWLMGKIEETNAMGVFPENFTKRL